LVKNYFFFFEKLVTRVKRVTMATNGFWAGCCTILSHFLRSPFFGLD